MAVRAVIFMSFIRSYIQKEMFNTICIYIYFFIFKNTILDI